MFRPWPRPAPRDVTARDAGGPVMAGAVRDGQRRDVREGPPCEGATELSPGGDRDTDETPLGSSNPTSALSPPCHPEN